MENDFLKNLPSQQVREIVDYMEKKKVVAGAYVIKEGDTGQCSIFEDIYVTYSDIIKVDAISR